MNGWLWAAVFIAGIAIVFLIVCIIAAAVSLKTVIQGLIFTVQRMMSEQVDPLLEQTKALTATANTLKNDVMYKKQQIDGIVMAVKEVNTSLTSLQTSTRIETQSLMKKIEVDPVRQAQTEQWTNKAMEFINRN